MGLFGLFKKEEKESNTGKKKKEAKPEEYKEGHTFGDPVCEVCFD
jgi:hypothetical protein